MRTTSMMTRLGSNGVFRGPVRGWLTGDARRESHWDVWRETILLVGGDWNHGILWLSIQLGISSSQLTNSIIFQGDWDHQPFYYVRISFSSPSWSRHLGAAWSPMVNLGASTQKLFVVDDCWHPKPNGFEWFIICAIHVCVKHTKHI